MSDVVKLATEPRGTSGSRAAAKLRKAGRIPAIIYGHKEEPVRISVSAVDLNRAVRVQHARVLDLALVGKTEKVLIRELQWDYLGDTMIHVDFERVSADEKRKVNVPVKLKNTPKITAGAVLEQPLHVLHIECPVGSIPDEFAVDIVGLTLGHPIHVRDLKLPAGVTVLDAPEMVVVQLKLPGAEEDAEVAEVTPEVIKKEKKAADADE